MNRYHRLTFKKTVKPTIEVMDKSKAIVIIILSGCFIIAMLMLSAGDKF